MMLASGVEKLETNSVMVTATAAKAADTRAVMSLVNVILFPSSVSFKLCCPTPQTLQEVCQMQKMAEFCDFRSGSSKVSVFLNPRCGDFSQLVGLAFRLASRHALQ